MGVRALKDRRYEPSYNLFLIFFGLFGVFFENIGLSQHQKATQKLQVKSHEVPSSIGQSIDFGNLEFSSKHKSQIVHLTKESYLKFSLGSITPNNPKYFDYFSTLRDLNITLSGLSSGDELIVSKDLNLDSLMQASEIVFQKKIQSPRIAVIEIPQLDRGHYIIKIQSKEDNPKYAVKMKLAPLTIPKDKVGDTPTAALELGESPKSKNVADFVGQVDPVDYFRFSIKNPSDIRLKIGGIESGHVMVKLYLDQNQDKAFAPDEMEYQTFVSPQNKHAGHTESLIQLAQMNQGLQKWTYRSYAMPGVYLIKVSAISGNSSYHLNLETEPLRLGFDTPNTPLSQLVENGFLPKHKFSVSLERVEGLGEELPYYSLDNRDQHYLDIRGVGDSAYSGNMQTFAPPPKYSDALSKFSKDQFIYKGDLNVINWESVVAKKCTEYSGSLGFISSPDAVLQAFRAGFHIFSLANNHARDCNQTPESGKFLGDGGAGELSTFRNMTRLSTKEGLIWSGISGASPKIWLSTRTMERGGRKFTVAFSSIDLGRDHCTRANCYSDRFEIAKAMFEQPADIKIVSIHSREWLDEKSQKENMSQLDKINHAMELFIGKGDVDVVFGTGCHSALPVRLITKKQGGVGIGFWSLGNFIHPNLLQQSTNIVGRVLFDLNKRRPVQVQAIMLRSNKKSVQAYDFDPSNIFLSGLPWREAKDPSTGLRVGFIGVHAPNTENSLKISENSH